MTREQLTRLAQDPKAFLRGSADSERKIRLKELEIQRYYDLAVSITQAIKPAATFSGGPSRKVEICATEIAALEEEITKEASDFYQSLVLIKEAIGFLDDPVLYNVLWARYVCHLSWAKVAETLTWSDRWTYKVHARALKELKQKALEKLK